jgi:hypothetical protein
MVRGVLPENTIDDHQHPKGERSSGSSGTLQAARWPLKEST